MRATAQIQHVPVNDNTGRTVVNNGYLFPLALLHGLGYTKEHKGKRVIHRGVEYRYDGNKKTRNGKTFAVVHLFSFTDEGKALMQFLYNAWEKIY